MNTELKEQMLEEEFLIGENAVDNKLKLKFDIGIIELLGDQLYTQLPAVLSEYISNSYDADSSEVEITFDIRDNVGSQTDIIISDNGIGIADDDSNYINQINNKYLKIGRRRRKDNNQILSKKYKRKIQGKKGIGKLAGFGITKKICITTISKNILNEFVLDYDEMHRTASNEEYYPKHLQKNVDTKIESGTIIRLCDISKKTEIDLEKLSVSLVKRNKTFDKNFKVTLIKKVNGMECDRKVIDVEMYLNSIRESNAIQFEWKIPSSLDDLEISESIKEYFILNNISGSVYTSSTPLKKDDQGIILYANGKLCQDNSTFSERANDNFYQYMFGYLDVDFIDADIDVDNISTARDSLVWGKEISENLKLNINEVIKKIQIKWRIQRKDDKKKAIKETGKIDIDNWLNNLPLSERMTANKIVDTILNDSQIDNVRASEYVGYVKDMYSYATFKDLAAQIVSVDSFSADATLRLIKDWKLIEAKELAKVSEGRIKTIDSFEKMIDENKSERDVIQPFIEAFPWLLDPKLINFEREVTYLKLLREKFDDSSFPESNRRIDFLTSISDGSLYIFELKRPNLKITKDYVTQVYDYESFIRSKDPHIKIKTFLVTNNCDIDRTAQSMIDSAKNDNKFDIKTYTELLAAARSYHKDIIEKYNEINNKESQ